METTQRAYLPAAGHDIFLPLYDPLVKLLGGNKAGVHSSTRQPFNLAIACSTSAAAPARWCY
jgi:hypothetical protein